jgi:hypothetical protein
MSSRAIVGLLLPGHRLVFVLFWRQSVCPVADLLLPPHLPLSCRLHLQQALFLHLPAGQYVSFDSLYRYVYRKVK